MIKILQVNNITVVKKTSCLTIKKILDIYKKKNPVKLKKK